MGIMDDIRESYEREQRELGWWGRFLMRHFDSIEKPPLMPWLPSGLIATGVPLLLVFFAGMAAGAVLCVG